MTEKTHCLSSMANGESNNNETSSYIETPRSPSADLTHTKGRASTSHPPDSSGSPAPSCTCGLELGYIPPCQIGDEEFDMVIFTRRCEIHEQDKHGDFLEELGDFSQPGLRLNVFGRMMRDQLWVDYVKEKQRKNSEVEVKIQTPGGVK